MVGIVFGIPALIISGEDVWINAGDIRRAQWEGDVTPALHVIISAAAFLVVLFA